MKVDGGSLASVDLCLAPAILSQEGQATLRLEERITRMYDELHQPVFRYLLCRSANPVDADDIVQETFWALSPRDSSPSR